MAAYSLPSSGQLSFSQMSKGIVSQPYALGHNLSGFWGLTQGVERKVSNFYNLVVYYP